MVTLELILQVLAAAIATACFSLLFGVPPRYAPFSGLIGGFGWLFYLLFAGITTATIATFLSTCCVILMSRWFAVFKRCPVTIFLIAGIIPLVPGASTYWAAYYIVSGKLPLASYKGFEALKLAVAIVLGIVFVFEIPEKFFHIGLKKRRPKTIKEEI